MQSANLKSSAVVRGCVITVELRDLHVQTNAAAEIALQGGGQEKLLTEVARRESVEV
jgi:hypothetical protein